jgi:hypothetical protein
VVSSRSSISEPAYLGNIVIVAVTIIVVLVDGKIDYLLLLRLGQDLPEGRKTVVVGIRDISVLREVGRATGRKKLARSRGPAKPMIIHRRQLIHRRQVEASDTAEGYNI